MGHYTDNLFKGKKRMLKGERLVSCVIIRDGEVRSMGLRSHGEIRAALGDNDPYKVDRRPTDQEGFLSSTGRFLDRREAVTVAQAAGQCNGRVGELLSSDVSW